MDVSLKTEVFKISLTSAERVRLKLVHQNEQSKSISALQVLPHYFLQENEIYIMINFKLQFHQNLKGFCHQIEKQKMLTMN